MPRKGKKTIRTTRHFVRNEVTNASTMEKSSTKPNPTEYAVAGHSSHTMELLKKDEKHCDAVIEAGGEKFKIHKSVFAIYSDYFDKVFTVEMQEKYDSVVKLDNTRSDVMKCIVDFIYSGQLSINSENAVELLVAADYLRIEKIKEFSASFLLQNVNAESCVGVWICARTYDLRDLLEQSANIFGSNLTSVAHEELCWLNNDQFLEIMESTKGRRKSEEEFFAVATIWAKYDLENRKETFCKFFQRFDLRHFSRDFLGNIARNESLITASVELLHKIVEELMARLEKECEEEEKNNRRIAELEKDKQVSREKIGKLQGENKRLTERVRVSVSCAEQAHSQNRTASQTIDSLANESKQLQEQLELSMKNFRHAEVQLQASAKTVDSLTKESKELAAQVEKISSKAHYFESQERICAFKVDELAAKNKRLSEQLHRRATAFHQTDKQQKALAKKNAYLTEQNKRLSKQIEMSSITFQQHHAQQKVIASRNDELTLENEELMKRVQRIAIQVQLAELHLRVSQDDNQWLSEQNHQLREQVDVYSNATEQAEDQRRELEIKADNLAEQNQRLAIQMEIETHNAQKATSKVLALEKRICDYVKENQGLSAREDKWLKLCELLKKEFRAYIQNVTLAINLIRSMINNSSKFICFPRLIRLSDEDWDLINIQLTQINLLLDNVPYRTLENFNDYL